MRILAVGDAFIDDVRFDAACEVLRSQGHTTRCVFWGPRDRSLLETRIREMEVRGPVKDDSLAVIENEMAGVDVLFVDFSPVTRDLMENVKIIGVCRTNVSNVALREATERGIPVLHVTGRNASAVAEFTIGLILAESRHIARAHCSLKSGTWIKQFRCVPTELEGKTVGLIGFGAIGRTIDRKLSGFDCEVVFYDPLVAAAPRDSRARRVDLTELLRRSDVVSIHAPLTEATRTLIGRKELELMKSSAYLVNTARAEIVDQEALLDALRQGLIRGAALDVFAVEPLPRESPFLTLDNVTLVPHLAGSTAEALEKSPRLLVKAFQDFMDKREPTNVVNPDALAGFRVT